jgi:hypothetical protein
MSDTESAIDDAISPSLLKYPFSEQLAVEKLSKMGLAQYLSYSCCDSVTNSVTY